MKPKYKLKIDKMSPEESELCFSVILGFTISMVIVFALPIPIPALASPILLAAPMLGVHFLLKKRRQKKSISPIFTDEKRTEWMKKRKVGFAKYASKSNLPWSFRAAIFLSLYRLYEEKGNYHVFSLLVVLAKVVTMFVFLFLFGVALTAYEWWDNADNEVEWQRKHPQLPPQ